MLTREDKGKIISNIRDNLNKSNAVFVTNLIGMPSNDSVKLRKEIRDVDGTVLVARNTLLKKAAEGTKYEKLVSNLQGPTALACSFNDAASVAKILFDSSKTFDVIKFRSGLLGDRDLTSSEIESLAKLPSSKQMLATLLATFNAPISAFVRCLDAIGKTKES
jgi:large subunit ribosomal protein L10